MSYTPHAGIFKLMIKQFGYLPLTIYSDTKTYTPFFNPMALRHLWNLYGIYMAYGPMTFLQNYLEHTPVNPG